MRPPGRFRASLTRQINTRGRRRRRRCGQARHYATRQCVIIKIAEPRGERSPVGREWGSRRVIYCAMRGKRPDFDLSGGRLSGAAGGMARSACATSMMSALGAPPFPRVTLTPLVASICAAASAGGETVCRTLAVTSGASSFRGAGKTSTFATANGSPAAGKSRRGSVTRPTAIARIATPVAVPIAGRLCRRVSAEAPPETRPSGSFSSSHTSVDAPGSERLRVANQPCPSLFSIARSRPSFPVIPDAGGASLPSRFGPDTTPDLAAIR